MLEAVPELLPRFYRFQEKAEAEKRVAKAILEADEYPDANGRVYRSSADGHRRDRRRGLPIISKGVGGTAPGTDPLGELLRKEARGELWR